MRDSKRFLKREQADGMAERVSTMVLSQTRAYGFFGYPRGIELTQDSVPEHLFAY